MNPYFSADPPVTYKPGKDWTNPTLGPIIRYEPPVWFRRTIPLVDFAGTPATLRQPLAADRFQQTVTRPSK